MLKTAMEFPFSPIAGILQQNVKRLWVHPVNKGLKVGVTGHLSDLKWS